MCAPAPTYAAARSDKTHRAAPGSCAPGGTSPTKTGFGFTSPVSRDFCVRYTPKWASMCVSQYSGTPPTAAASAQTPPSSRSPPGTARLSPERMPGTGRSSHSRKNPGPERVLEHQRGDVWRRTPGSTAPPRAARIRRKFSSPSGTRPSGPRGSRAWCVRSALASTGRRRGRHLVVNPRQRARDTSGAAKLVPRSSAVSGRQLTDLHAGDVEERSVEHEPP
jgi:hypothetical protein